MRSLYRDGIVRVVVIPTWAKLIDLETNPAERSRNWSGSGRSVSVLSAARPLALGGSPTPYPTAVRGVCEVRQEMSRWDVESPRAAPSPE